MSAHAVLSQMRFLVPVVLFTLNASPRRPHPASSPGPPPLCCLPAAPVPCASQSASLSAPRALTPTAQHRARHGAKAQMIKNC